MMRFYRTSTGQRLSYEALGELYSNVALPQEPDLIWLATEGWEIDTQAMLEAAKREMLDRLNDDYNYAVLQANHSRPMGLQVNWPTLVEECNRYNDWLLQGCSGPVPRHRYLAAYLLALAEEGSPTLTDTLVNRILEIDLKEARSWGILTARFTRAHQAIAAATEADTAYAVQWNMALPYE